jgi:hypothetical protein
MSGAEKHIIATSPGRIDSKEVTQECKNPWLIENCPGGHAIPESLCSDTRVIRED